MKILVLIVFLTVSCRVSGDLCYYALPNRMIQSTAHLEPSIENSDLPDSGILKVWLWQHSPIRNYERQSLAAWVSWPSRSKVIGSPPKG